MADGWLGWLGWIGLLLPALPALRCGFGGLAVLRALEDLLRVGLLRDLLLRASGAAP